MTATNPPPAIAVSGLTKQFDTKLAVSDMTFAVPAGAVTGFVGANGSGKTTTMRIILGLIRPDAGTALIHGQQYKELAEPRRQVGAVLSKVGGHPGLSGRQHLRFVASGANIKPERISEVLEAVGLTDAAERKLGTYSTGMGQRLALAAALMGKPSVLILDEPMSGLDPHGIAWLRGFLGRQASEGATVFVSTHQLSSIEPILDHVVVINNGHVVQEGSPASLTQGADNLSLEDAVLTMTNQGAHS